MKKFSQYSKSEQPIKGYTQEDEVAKLGKKIAEAYDGKPSVEMLRTVLAQAEESKKKGTLTNEDIDDFYAQFAPLIDEKQRKTLQAVVEKLKRI